MLKKEQAQWAEDTINKVFGGISDAFGVTENGLEIHSPDDIPDAWVPAMEGIVHAAAEVQGYPG